MAAAARGRGLSQRLGHSWSILWDSWLGFPSWREELTSWRRRDDQLAGRDGQLMGRVDQLAGRDGQLMGRVDQLAGRVDQLVERDGQLMGEMGRRFASWRRPAGQNFQVQHLSKKWLIRRPTCYGEKPVHGPATYKLHSKTSVF